MYKNYYTSTPFSSHLTVVVGGFVDTLFEVNETDGQVTLNVSISSPQPDPFLLFEITFSLNVGSVEGSAGMDDISNVFVMSVLLYTNIPSLSLIIMNFD